MSLKVIKFASVFFILTVASLQSARAEFFSTRSVRFMEGEWILKNDNFVAQEIWSSAQGDSMAGICRHVQDEETVLFELMSLKEKNGGLYLNIKHFDRDMKPWEATKESGELKMVSGDHFGKAIFENTDKKKHLRITYELKKGRLFTLVEVTKNEEETKRFEFNYQPEKHLKSKIVKSKRKTN